MSGITIGLCILLGKHFPGWGEGAGAMRLGAVVINAMLGPILFRGALLRSHEGGKREAVVVAH